MREVLRNYQKNGSSIAIMQASDDSILYKVLLTKFFICFLLPYLKSLMGYIAYSSHRFCSSNHTKGRKVGIIEMWIQGRLTPTYCCSIHHHIAAVFTTILQQYSPPYCCSIRHHIAAIFTTTLLQFTHKLSREKVIYDLFTLTLKSPSLC